MINDDSDGLDPDEANELTERIGSTTNHVELPILTESMIYLPIQGHSMSDFRTTRLSLLWTVS